MRAKDIYLTVNFLTFKSINFSDIWCKSEILAEKGFLYVY